MTAADTAETEKGITFEMRPRDGYVFIVTYGRSGSTLTQNLLNAIPGYCIRGENGNILAHLCRAVELIRREPNYKMRHDQKAGKGRPVPEMGQPSDPWYGAEAVDADRLARRLFHVFQREVLQLPLGTRVGGFKEIRYFNDLPLLPRQLELMQQYFPKARIIFLTRDHGQVSNSAWWKGHDRDGLLARLAEADAVFAEYATSHAGCFQLDFSAYAEGPEGLRPLFDFLGEPFDPVSIAAVLDRPLTHMKGPA